MTGVKTMLVDDDAFTRVLLTKAIESLGHQVLGAFESVSAAAVSASLW